MIRLLSVCNQIQVLWSGSWREALLQLYVVCVSEACDDDRMTSELSYSHTEMCLLFKAHDYHLPEALFCSPRDKYHTKDHCVC